LLLVVQGHGG
jgi:hypothetical protein